MGSYCKIIPDCKPDEERRRLVFEVYRPAFKKMLFPSHVCQHMSFMGEHHSEIMQLERREGREVAVEEFMLRLSECGEPGWYMSFVTALRNAEFFTLHDLLEGHKDVKDETVFEHILRIFYEDLTSRLDPKVILPTLESQMALSSRDREYITRITDNEGRTSGMTELLHRLTKKKSGWFVDLLGALSREESYKDLAEVMSPELAKIVRTGIFSQDVMESFEAYRQTQLYTTDQSNCGSARCSSEMSQGHDAQRKTEAGDHTYQCTSQSAQPKGYIAQPTGFQADMLPHQVFPGHSSYLQHAGVPVDPLRMNSAQL